VAKAETKSELHVIISNLELRLEGNREREAYQKRELANVMRLFVSLFEDLRTQRLRFGWLEEAAADVVNACPEHLPGLIVKLADEIGIELKQEK
jgi:hypothetical protein